MVLEEGTRLLKPAPHYFAVAVHELHIPQLLPAVPQARESSVARPSGSKWLAQVEPQHLYPQGDRQRDRTVRGTRIHIHHLPHAADDGFEASAQPLAFVTAYDDGADGRSAPASRLGRGAMR